MKLWRPAATPSVGSPGAVEVSKIRSAVRRGRVALLIAISVGLTALTWGSTGAIAGPLTQGPVPYVEGGGGVEHSPHVYAILWGSNWNKAPGTEAKAMLLKFYEGLSNSAWEGILTQYFDATGRVGKTVALTTYTDTGVTAPSSVNATKVQAEVKSAIETNKWTAESNNQFVVVAAPGSTYEKGFLEHGCAYHAVIKEGKIVFAFIPYQGDEPFTSCLSFDTEKSAINGTTKSASHEFAEVVTDPYENTWHTLLGEEIADLCDEEFDVELPDGAWATNIYDDHTNTCSHEDLEPPFVYGATKNPSEITGSSARLEGTVNPEGQETKYSFEYGLTVAYGKTTTPASAGSTNKNQIVGTAISGLTGKTNYEVRIVATNSTGTTYGRNRQFTTG
jgi:hypothetical protein